MRVRFDTEHNKVVDTSYNVVTVGANYTVDILDDLVAVTTIGVVVTLPLIAASQQKPYIIVNKSAGNITVQVQAPDLAANWVSPVVLATLTCGEFIHDSNLLTPNALNQITGNWLRVRA